MLSKIMGIKITKKLSDRLIILFFSFTLLYLIFQILRVMPSYMFDFSKLQSVNIYFLSILFEAFPFILIGILASSMIQVLMPAQLLENLMAKNKIKGFLIALFAGFFFPVCDCAIVPVAASLAKKNVPLPIIAAFSVSAPIINPIVIVSTIYAFPGYPLLALYRVGLGLLVALFAGVAFIFISPHSQSTISSDTMPNHCSCGHCGEHTHEHTDIPGKIDAVLKHAVHEFFDVGRYLIAGAFISSVIQVYMPKSILTTMGSNSIFSLLLMMSAGFALSVCSTSDAFIARTFVNTIPVSSVMGFMILGPILDLKNLFMLTGKFKKSFVIKFVLIVFSSAFIVLFTINKFFFRRWF